MKHEETPQSFHLHLRQIQTHSSQAHPNSVPNFTVTSSPSHHLPILSNAISLLTLSPPGFKSCSNGNIITLPTVLIYNVGYDLNGERMPELRTGARRSKWLGDLQTGALAVNQGVNWAEPAQNRTRRRVGAGRGGNATGLGKGSSPPQDELQLVEAAEQD